MSIRQSRTWLRLGSLPGIRHFTLRVGIFCMIMSLCVFSNGFDLLAYSNIQAMTGFQQRFGNKCNPKTGVCTLDSAHLSMLNSIPLIGFGLGVLFASWIGERFGRRVVFVFLNCMCLVGVGITYSASTYAQILIGRCLVQAYVGMENWLIPMYQSEIVPAKIRGAIVGNYFTFKLIGGIVMSCICYKTHTIPGDRSWKIPIEVMFIVPGLCLVLTWLVPESPRWLLRKGKSESALGVLCSINDGNEAIDVQLELLFLEQALEAETEQGTWTDMFTGSNLRRTMIAILSNFFGFASGQQFSNVYGTIFLAQNVKSVNPFEFTIYTQLGSVVGGIIFLTFIDRVGRRFFWLTAAPLGATVMVVMGILGCIPNPSNSVSYGIASMFPIFNLFFISSFGLLPALIIAEIPSLRLRDKTAMVGWTTQNITNFLISFTVPYLTGPSQPTANLRARVGFIYAFFGWVGVFWAYFYAPELGKRSLEEIDEMLRLKVPARKTKNWKPSADSVAGQLTKLEDSTHLASDSYKLKELPEALEVEDVAHE